MPREAAPTRTQCFEVQSRVELDKEEGSYVVSLEVPCALEMVTFTSTVRLDLLDPPETTAILGLSPPVEGKPVIATFRFQEATTRTQIRYVFAGRRISKGKKKKRKSLTYSALCLCCCL